MGEAEVSHVGTGLRLVDLHLTLRDIASATSESSLDATDAFLLAAGASQIARDAYEADPGSLRRASAQLEGAAPRALRGVLRRGAAVASRGVAAVRDLGGGAASIGRLADGLDEVTDRLAGDLGEHPPDHTALASLTALLGAPAARFGWAAEPTTALPSCFRSFDLHPNDLSALAARVVDRVAPAPPGYLVLGVRTSGSYLAPILASALRRLGAEVTWRTLRPGRPIPAAVRQLVGELANRAWRLVVVDDPPGSGGSFAAAAAAAFAMGFPSDATLLAFALHEGQTVPARLAGLTSVVLEWPEWDVHRRTDAPAVAAVLSGAGLGPLDASELRPVALPRRPVHEGHARAGYELPAEPGGVPAVVVAEGSGLGYLGRHTVAVAERLGGDLPRVYGFGDGITVRAWLDERARTTLGGARLDGAVRYAAARREALPALRDASARMAGRQPVWEVASRLLATPYREVGLAVRAASLDDAVRHLLAPAAPSVIDGQTGSGSWFEVDGALRKVAWADRAFSHLDLACYDAAYDLAGAVADVEDPGAVAAAVAEFERRTHGTVSPERLVLYRMVHLWDRARVGQLAPDVAEVRIARAWQEWARQRLLGEGCDAGTAGFCVLDIDGVLETGRLGAPTLTPSSATALRALRDHGLRPMLATGRSLTELKDRCARYGLVGGTAEYGGIAYAHHDGATRSLLDARDHQALAELRERLAAMPDVLAATEPTTMVRAYRPDGAGGRRALDARVVDELRHEASGRLTAIGGRAQTDFVAYGVDKAHGIRAALELLGEPAAPVELAVGDAEPDLGILRMASAGYVPSNGAHLAGRGIVATRHGFQRGLLEAVHEAVGHGDAPCVRCAPPPELRDGAALLAEVLRGLEGGRTVALRAAPRVLRLASAIGGSSSTAPPARTPPVATPASPPEGRRSTRGHRAW